jgi:hypothetical protein
LLFSSCLPEAAVRFATDSRFGAPIRFELRRFFIITHFLHLPLADKSAARAQSPVEQVAEETGPRLRGASLHDVS